MALTRTIKFEVVFPGLRSDDRLPLYRRLWGVQADLTRAANKLISAAWLAKIGTLPLPKTAKDPEVTAPFQSCFYMGLSGAWQPFGRPLYEPYQHPKRKEGNARAGSRALLDLAGVVQTRLEKDWTEIISGKMSLATFRELPIGIAGAGIDMHSNGNITLSVFEGRKNNRITVRPRKLDPGQNEILHRCRSKTLEAGSAKLLWEKREGARGRWTLSLSWTEKSADAANAEVVTANAANAANAANEDRPPLVAGVDIGIQHAVWMAFTTFEGVPVNRPKLIQFPRRTLRAVERVSVERRERLSLGRAELDLRSGRGVTRKIRAAAAISDKVERLNDTMIAQIAALTVSEAKRRGATLLVIEDHGDWSVAQMHAQADNAGSKAVGARIRSQYFRWHQGAMRQQLREVAAREHLPCVEINPAWTSRTCHMCGLIWKRDWYKRVWKGEGLDEPHFGRIELRKFVCSCGYEGHADHNAAINIARLGLRKVKGEAEPEIAPVRGRKRRPLAVAVESPAAK